ncbi:hypothetical protein ACFSE1_16250 [Rhizobium helianthi]|uniref:Uncharacterized protein n=1 Tax=Rhizobium helianthi TaxID=1132695 RepID=A0ABW4M8R3_9HYPH
MEQEMTFQELTSDPLIALLMQADGVAVQDLDELRKHTAERELAELQTHIRKSHADDFYRRLDQSMLARQAYRKSAS